MVGSSRTTTSGSQARTEPRATLFLSPPLRMKGLDFWYLSMSRRFRAQSTLLLMTSLSNPKFLRAKLISSSTFSEKSWSSGFWKTRPTFLARAATLIREASSPSTETRPA